ncbi:MAG: tyrosine-type recombinase/integrase [Caldilinea sp.]
MISDAFELFLLDCESRGFTPDTVRFYRDRFRLIQRWCTENGIDTLDKLTPLVIRQYLAVLQRRGLSSHYVHSHARALRTFCNFLVREELLDVSPFAKVKMPRLEKKVLAALTSEEVKVILRACEYERDTALVLFLLDSGVRASELCALNVGDVDVAGTVTVRLGKGQKGRLTYIGARTRKQLLRYFTLERGGKPDADEPLFTAQRMGKPLTPNALFQLTKRLKKASGVKGCAPHAFRRTMAIHSLRNGMNIYLLARMLGHTDIHVLKQYLDIVQNDVQTAAKRSGVVDNLW